MKDFIYICIYSALLICLVAVICLAYFSWEYDDKLMNDRQPSSVSRTFTIKVGDGDGSCRIIVK